jgi:hypothetical protein
MNAPIETDLTTAPESVPTNWRPPGWVDGDDDPYAPDEGHTPENTEASYAEFDGKGYYTRGGLLTDKGLNAKDSDTAAAVSANRKRLRDAWNTHPSVWRLASLLIGRPFKVDPFWNQGARELPALERTLDGLSPAVDGLLSVEKARERLGRHHAATDPAERMPAAAATELELCLAALGPDVAPDFPACWRGPLTKGSAAAAVNGPHSITEKWLRLAWHYSQEEYTAGFTPDNGDGWFQELGMRFSIVVRLGRVSCLPPPGITSSSPRGASALLIGIPLAVQAELRELAADLAKRTTKAARREEIVARMDALLPAAARRVLLEGANFRVPLWSRPKAGVQYAYVQPGSVGETETIDMGLLG